MAPSMSAAEALERLRRGNETYLGAASPVGDVSAGVRELTARQGQRPFAVVITCSDSRVIPESIFSAGIGEIFVIRSAGNVIGGHELGSVEYAVDHLGCRLVVVMGHTHCGAVGAALQGGGHGFVKSITDEILLAAGGETDPDRACVLNVRRGERLLREKLELPEGTRVIGAVYSIEDGAVEFLE